MNIFKINTVNNVSFTRAIRPDEEKDYAQTNVAAKKFLGIKNLALVLHGSNFPQADKDLFIGSPFSAKAAETNDFLKMHGFDSIQLGPPGLIKQTEANEEEDYSPYISSVNSKNYLFADMSKLATGSYANILKNADIEAETSKDYDKSTMTDFEKAFGAYDRLFEKAYDNMNSKDDVNANKLKAQFENFKEKSGEWLENDALFEVIKKEYQTSKIDEWSDLDKNLIKYKNDPQSEKHEEAIDVIDQLNESKDKEIELYKFKQFIMEKQENEFNQEHPGKLQYISDAIIGFSTRDLWGNQEAFMDGYCVGVPNGGEGNYDNGHKTNQTWGIPVINPKTIFNEDGSLGKGGLMFKQKFEKLLDTYQNIRVDHVLGLIDPWIYEKNNVEVLKDDQGKIVSTDAHGAFLSDRNWDCSVDPKGDYTKILEKILLPILKEKNLKVNDVVWESLGEESWTFHNIYHDELNLPGIVDLKGYRGQNKSGDNWLLLSTHDDPPFAKIAETKANKSQDYYENNKSEAMDPCYLIGFMHPEKTDEERKPLIDNLATDTRLKVISKNQELMRCGEKIQISFMDFFGLDKTYNEKGHDSKDNWKLRLSKDYKKDYYKTLEDKDSRKVALNVPELLKRAVISKIYTSGKPKEEQEQDFKNAESLINKLNHYEKILYEPENDAKKTEAEYSGERFLANV